MSYTQATSSTNASKSLSCNCANGAKEWRVGQYCGAALLFITTTTTTKWHNNKNITDTDTANNKAITR